MNSHAVETGGLFSGQSLARGAVGVVSGGVAWLVLTAAILCGAELVGTRIPVQHRVATALWIMAPAGILVGASAASTCPAKARTPVLP